MNKIKEFIKEEDGIGVVEIILILVILIGLVVIFKEEIEKIVKNAFDAIQDDAGEIVGED
jgi:Flp pilus assembly pilin Flp